MFSALLCNLVLFDLRFFFPFLLLLGREDPHPMDSTRSDCLPQIHISQWRLELRHRDVGSDVLRREALLGNDKPRCKHVWHLPRAGTLRALVFILQSERQDRDKRRRAAVKMALLPYAWQKCSSRLVLYFAAAAAENRLCAEGNVSAQRQACFPQQTAGASLMLLELEPVPLLLNDKDCQGIDTDKLAAFQLCVQTPAAA